MNDYYSHFPGPTIPQAMVELLDKTNLNHNPIWLKRFIQDCILLEYDKYGNLGSYTGWNVTVKPNIIEKIKYKIQLRERSKQLLRKLFYHFQVYGVFLKLYKDVYYKPNGYYMNHIQSNYKNIFK
jgi:hypothetical protein